MMTLNSPPIKTGCACKEKDKHSLALSYIQALKPIYFSICLQEIFLTYFCPPVFYSNKDNVLLLPQMTEVSIACADQRS